VSPTTTATRPRMDPRIGRRRAAVTRARGRKRLRLVVTGVVVVALGVAALVVLHSSLLSARHVQVQGTDHTTTAAVLRAAGLDGAPPLVDVDSTAAAARIARLPWVASATVTRHWPDTVVVQVRERTAVAVVARGASGGFALVDGTGRVLEWVASAPAGVVTVVTTGHAGAPGSTLDGRAAGGLAVAAACEEALPGRVHQVTVAGDGSVTIDLGGGVSAELGPATDVGAKLAALASVLSAAAPTGPSVIDVRVPAEPTVAPVSPTPTGASATGAAAPAGASAPA